MVEAVFLKVYSQPMIEIISRRISEEEMRSFLGKPFSQMIKFVVDLQRGRIALGGELHADAETLLLQEGSKQSDLWGGNYYPSKPPDERIEYTAMINIRTWANNPSMEIQDQNIRSQIRGMVERLLP